MYAVIKWHHEGSYGAIPASWLDTVEGVIGAWWPPRKVFQKVLDKDSPDKSWRHYAGRPFETNLETFKDAERLARRLVAATDSEQEMTKIREQSNSNNGGKQVGQSFDANNVGGHTGQNIVVTNDGQQFAMASDISLPFEQSGIFADNTAQTLSQHVVIELPEAISQNAFSSNIQASSNGSTLASTPNQAIYPVSTNADTSTPAQTFSQHVLIEVPQTIASQDMFSSQNQFSTAPLVSTPTTRSNNIPTSRNIVNNQVLLKKLITMETEMKSMHATITRMASMINSSEPDITFEVPRWMNTVEAFTTFDEQLSDASVMRKMLRFLLPFARDGLCSRSIYGIMAHLGQGLLWRSFSLRGQRDTKRRFDRTNLYAALRRFCVAANYKYKDLDDSISVYLKKFKRPKDQGASADVDAAAAGQL